MMSLIKKSLLLALSATCFLSSLPAQAAPGRKTPNRCLEQASDSEILNELSYRLRNPGSAPNIGNNLQYSMSCSYQMLKVITTDLSTGSSKITEIDLNQSSSCASVATILARKIEQNRSGAIIAASCNYQMLSKVILLNGTIKTESFDLSQSSACQTQANIINQ